MPRYQLIDAIEYTSSHLGIFKALTYTEGITEAQLSPHIQAAELEDMIPLFGNNMYQDMVANRISTPYKRQVNFLFPPAFTAYNDLWERFAYNWFGKILSCKLAATTVAVTNVGASDPDNPEFKPAPAENRRLAINELKSSANTFRQNIINYLCNNKADFPLWYEEIGKKMCGCELNDVPNKINKMYFVKLS